MKKGVKKALSGLASKTKGALRGFQPSGEQVAFMKLAIELAQKKMLEGNGGPFGCIVVKDGRVVAEGFNAVTSRNDPTAHAEVVAIRRACEVLGTFQLSGCELYTSCEPCPMCLGAIYWARPDRVFYASTRKDAMKAGFDDDFIYRELSLPNGRRARPMKQILRDQGWVALEAWISKPDKTLY